MRYVEGNPVRTGLVSSAKEWEWSSHRERIRNKKRKLVDDPPIEMPVEWDKYVDEPLIEKELERLWQSVNRQSSFEDIIYQQKVSKAYGLESTIRPVGRPKKNEEGKKKQPVPFSSSIMFAILIIQT